MNEACFAIRRALFFPTIPQSAGCSFAPRVLKATRGFRIKSCMRAAMVARSFTHDQNDLRQRGGTFSLEKCFARMIRIAISTEAFDALDAVSALLPLGTVNFEREPDANGERLIWLAPDVFNKLRALREPGESQRSHPQAGRA